MKNTFLFATLIGSTITLASGCGKQDAPAKLAAPGKHDEAEHAHAKGVVAMGDYHARILTEQGGVLKLYILGKDENKIAAIETQDVNGHIRTAADAEAIAVTLKADPQPGDPKGKTSQFVGQVPEKLRNQPLYATFRLNIGGEAYRPEFKPAESDGHGGHAGMPKGLKRNEEGISQEEKDFYLTPGGIYTAADITANGNTVPSQKFKGMRWTHPKAKPGDKLCPVTDNKADAKCSWIVGGKTYEFCCPPCLDKFIDMAKHEPETIKDPEAYIKE